MEQILGSSSQDVLQPPVPGGRSLTTEQRRTVDHSSRINGWGSDMAPERRPGVPRDKAPELGVEHLYPPIPAQRARVRIHKSTEHGRMPPVFGTSCPPRGLSGRLRDLGYKYSEGRLARWMTLLVADRVDVVEGIVADLARGRVPNIPKEMGIRAELKHNRNAFLLKTGLVAAAAVAAAAYWRSRR
jgi:hypothetical protein